MKKRLTVLVMVLCLGMAFMIPQSAISADLLWADTNVVRIAQTSTKVQVVLDHVSGVFEGKLFNISNEKQNAMLAVLLTAMTMKKVVRIAFYDGTPAAEIEVVVALD
jgi:hypothetical protein